MADYYQVIFSGPGASISVTSTNNPYDHPYYQAGSTITIHVTSNDGYVLTSCYIDGVETNYATVTVNSDIYVTATTEAIGDSGGSGDESDTNILVHPDTNCIYLGTSQGGITYSNDDLRAVDTAYIKFKTPSDLVSCEDITLIFDSEYGEWGFSFNPTDEDYGGWLYFDVYKGLRYSGDQIYHESTKFDGYTKWGKWTISLIGHLKGKFERDFEPDTEYNIVLYTTDGTISFDVPVAVILDYTARAGVRIDNGTSYKKYLVYIDDGTSWNMYEPYIDNGTSWEIIY